MEQKKQKRTLNKFARFSGIAFQMGATIYFAIYLGKKLDTMYPSEKNWFTIIMTLVGLIVSMYLVVVQTKNINN